MKGTALISTARPDMRAVPAYIGHDRAGAVGAADQVDLIMAHRLADLVQIVHRVGRPVAAEIRVARQLLAAGAEGGDVEDRLEIGLELDIGTGDAAIQPVALARSALVDEHDVVMDALPIPGSNGGKFGRRLARSADDEEDRRPLGAALARRDEDDAQRQPAAGSRLPVLEDMIDAAAQLLVEPRYPAGLQTQLRLGWHTCLRGNCGEKSRRQATRQA